MIVGARIRATRLSHGLTIEALSNLCDLHPTSIARIERGDNSPTLQTLFRIAESLDTDAANFIVGVLD